ncbi:MAG: PemK domain-containing protein, partial [Microbacterium sp.]
EVVWTWVPYEENDGRGKDRPVLVIGRHSADRVFAVRLTSKAHDAERDFLPIGSGAWDSQGRPSWVDIEQLYSVHREGMRREASAIDVKRFAVVAQALQRRYGWQAGE